MSKETTKDRILNAALELFAEKGYDGVGVDLIAEAIGMKGPSLYKHFKGKEAILNAVAEQVGVYYDMNFGTEKHPGKIPESMEELTTLSLARIQFTMHDPSVQKVRRLLAQEQFRNPAMADLATKHHIDGIVGMYSKIFAAMMEAGTMKQDDPDQLAMEYAAPITLLIHTYDRQPEREEEVLERMRKHLSHFSGVYGV